MEENNFSCFDAVREFIEDPNNDSDSVDLVYNLYDIIISLIAKNGVLEMENNLLNRQLTIAENRILSLS